MNPVVVTMHGPRGSYDIRDMSNFEAGVVVLSRLNELIPGLTWGQLAAGVDRPEVMAGWLTDLGKAVKGGGSAIMDVGRSVGGTVMDITRSGGSIVGDAFDATGDKIGDAVRLFTDKKVIDSLNSAYKTYTDGGGLAGFYGGNYMSMFQGQGDDSSLQNAAGGIWEFITNLGAGAKSKTNQLASVGGLPGGPLPWAIAGGVILVLLLRGHR